MEELRNVLYAFDEPLSGAKSALVSRILTAGRPELEVLRSLNNETLRSVLSGHGFSYRGRKSELVVRLIQSEVVKIGEDEVLRFMEGLEPQEFREYLALLFHVKAPTFVQRLVGLLDRASIEDLPVFARVLRSFPMEQASATLVGALAQGKGDIPCFASFLLEELIESRGTVGQVLSALTTVREQIQARQRSIRASCRDHDDLAHPAVDAMLGRIWMGEPLQPEAVVADVQRELRTRAQEIRKTVESLRDESSSETLTDVKGRTMEIDKTTRDIHTGVRALEAHLKAIEKKIEDSPDRVAETLSSLSKSRQVAWTTRRRIRRDLKQFWRLVDRAQKVEFLGRSILSYGPLVVAALKGLL